jgi:hypothetical protein
VALKLLYNPISGNFDYINDAVSAGPSNEYKVDKITLTGADITNKTVTLDEIPTTLNETRLVVIGGIEQEYGADFVVSGTTLSWNGLGLDGLLSAGEKIVVIYN